MGTSSNQPSPDTPNWRLPKAVLGMIGVAAERQSNELWKAAVGDQGEALIVALSAEPLARAGDIAETARDPLEAAHRYDAALAELGHAGLFVDIGKRALLRSVIARSGRSGFGAELFSEAASYYASRDLGSVVAQTNRVHSVDQVLELKDRLRAIASHTAAGAPLGRGPGGWRAYVSAVLERLTAKAAR